MSNISAVDGASDREFLGEFESLEKSNEKGSSYLAVRLMSQIISDITKAYNYFFPKHLYTNKREFRFIPTIIEDGIGKLLFYSSIEENGVITDEGSQLCKDILSDLKSYSRKDFDYQVEILDRGGKVRVL